MTMTRSRTIGLTVLAISLCVPAMRARAASAEDVAQAREIMARAIDFLRSQQDQATGGWSVNPQGPNFPAMRIELRAETARHAIRYAKARWPHCNAKTIK